MEMLVVLAIIATLIGLLVPATMRAREAARGVTCKSNLRQVCLGMNQLLDSLNPTGTKRGYRFPTQPEEGTAGGWSVDVIPFLDEKNLGLEIDGVRFAQIPTSGQSRPKILSCPSSQADLSSFGQIQAAHYVANGGRMTEAPNDSKLPWLVGPEDDGTFEQRSGPHRGGYHIADIHDGAVRLQ